MTAEAWDDQMAAFREWHAAAVERDNAERRGPVLAATGSDGQWNEEATAAGWPPEREVPV
jgi:hypothetical protein